MGDQDKNKDAAAPTVAAPKKAAASPHAASSPGPAPAKKVVAVAAAASVARQTGFKVAVDGLWNPKTHHTYHTGIIYPESDPFLDGLYQMKACHYGVQTVEKL